jgi:tripartite-type tricarboxylate transporter receptor subunit TctC
MKRLLSCAVVALALGSAALAQAQTAPTGSAYPSRPVRVIVPFAPGEHLCALAALGGMTVGHP